MLKYKSLRMRRFIAKYIRYLEVFGYLFVLTLATGLFMAWFYKVDDTVTHDKDPEIRPKETIVKNANDAYITRLLVTDKFQQVREGQPLVEIIDDPAWVDRFRAVLCLQDAVKEWEALEERHPRSLAPSEPADPGPLAAEDAQLRQSVEQSLAAWEEAAGRKAPRKILRAEHDGVVLIDEKLAGTVVEKDKEIAKLADFSKLQVELKLKGENLPDVRVGQVAKVEVRPEQPPTRILRGDREGFLWRAERVQFDDLIDDPIKNWLRDELQQHPVSRDDRKDIALEVADIESIKVDAKLATAPVAMTEVPDPRDRLEPNHIHELELRGRVSVAKHTSKISLPELPAEIETALRQKLLEKVRGKVVAEDAEPFRIEGFRSMAPMIKVKAETSETPKSEEERQQQIEKALMGNREERFVEATVVLDDPPPILTEAVKKFYLRDKPAGPRVDVDVVTARRRFAMLLFKQ